MVKQKIVALLKEILPKEDILVASPKEENFGDYSTNIALILASKKRQSPLELAKQIVKSLPKVDFLKKVEAVPPGFINFYLSEEWLTKQIKEIIVQKKSFGSCNLGKGEKVQIEFVSANPTGPLTLGNGRGGFLGDVLARILEFAGFEVEREYYVNDTGNQITILGKSILAVKQGSLKTKEFLEENQQLYRGQYIEDLAGKVTGDDPKKVGYQAAMIILSDIIKKTVEKAGIRFDSWILESSLIKQGLVKKAIERLKRKGMVYEKEGAVWFSSSKFGDDKDRVLIKQDGEYTYFASDIAYHLNKVSRGYSQIIDIWGADHHGDVPRIMAAAEALGFASKLKIILHQFVRLIQGGKVVRMSKRSGTYITLSELIDEVGLDAVRFFFLTKSAETHLDFDIDKAKEKSEQNPVYYIQYASARIHGILEKKQPKLSEENLRLLIHPAEILLIKHLIKLPELVEEIARDYQVQKLPFYALKLANLFHNFYEKCRVLDESSCQLSEARLALVLASKIVLENVLNLMGIKAPERM